MSDTKRYRIIDKKRPHWMGERIMELQVRRWWGWRMLWWSSYDPRSPTSKAGALDNMEFKLGYERRGDSEAVGPAVVLYDSRPGGE